MSKLAEENECLKRQVEKLKFDLECIRVQNGGTVWFRLILLPQFIEIHILSLHFDPLILIVFNNKQILLLVGPSNSTP